MWTFSKGLCILRSVTRIMVKTYNCSCNRNMTCIFGDAVTFIKDCRVLFGDIFIVPFLGSALGLAAMCSLGWGNLVAFDWNDLPVGREFDCKFLKKVKSPPHALPPPPRRHYIDRCITKAAIIEMSTFQASGES